MAEGVLLHQFWLADTSATLLVLTIDCLHEGWLRNGLLFNNHEDAGRV